MITIDLGNDSGALLPGEIVLWTGVPASSRLRLAEAVDALIYLIPAVVFCVWAGTSLHRNPAIFVAMGSLVGLYAAFQSVAALIRLLVLRTQSRRELYQITNWRVLVTSGLRERHTWSAYLDQIAEPLVRPGRGGLADLVLRPARAPAPRRGLAAFVGQDGPFEIDDEGFPVLLSVDHATIAAHTITVARSEMMAGNVPAVPARAVTSGAAVPGSIGIGAGEHVLWAGRPATVPWWFGYSDLSVSAFGLMFLLFTGLMCAGAALYFPAALIFFVPFALAGGGYPSIGRVLLRRLRIGHSTYVVTNQRVIATWQLAHGPVVVQGRLADLLPPELRDRSLIMRPAARPQAASGRAWDRATWPVTAAGPPSLIGLADPGAVGNVICAAQLAARERPGS